MTGARLTADEYLEALELLLASESSTVLGLTEKLAAARTRFFAARSEGKAGTAAVGKAREQQEKIASLQATIDSLIANLAASKEEGGRELRELLEAQGEAMAAVKEECEEAFREELKIMKADYDTQLRARVSSERSLALTAAQKAFSLHLSQLATVEKASASALASERAKVTRVLAAVQDAEVKRREAERDKDREDRGGGGKGREGKSAQGAARKMGGKVF